MTDRGMDTEWTTANELVEATPMLPVSDVLRLCAVDMLQLQHIVAEDVVTPTAGHTTEWTFSSSAIPRIKRVARLQAELDLDAHAAVIVLELLDELRWLRATHGTT